MHEDQHDAVRGEISQSYWPLGSLGALRHMLEKLRPLQRSLIAYGADSDTLI